MYMRCILQFTMFAIFLQMEGEKVSEFVEINDVSNRPLRPSSQKYSDRSP